MPLLYKKAFRRNELPDDLDDSEEVFFCELTNEVFRDYEEFCERIILCNSLVWSCCLSGKSNLTYQEALASEENAKLMLNDFPMELRIPVLYLTTLTQRKSLNELAEDVYCFAKDRYFIGENVEVELPGGSLTSCNIIKVIPPTEEQFKSCKKENVKNGERQYWPPANVYRYQVLPVDGEKKSQIVAAEFIHRKKSYYSRAKNRLYIKQFTEQVDGYWKLKALTAEKYGISRVKFDLIFVGDAPDLSPSKKSSPNQNGKKEKRQESIDKYFTKRSPSKQGDQQANHSDSQQKTLLQKLKEKYKVQNAKNNTLSNKIAGKHDAFRQKRKYTKRKLLQASDKNNVLSEMELKQRKREEKLKIREQIRMKKEQVSLLMKEYNRKRDDLELEDLQDLPEPLPIELRVPNELFGDFVMVMEFLNTFKDTVNLKDYFPNGVTIDLLERALADNEVAGPLCDILQMLLTSIFELQEDEDDEICEDSDLKSPDIEDLTDIGGNDQTKEAVREATIAARWSKAYHRTRLSKLTLDASTLTEVLRLHLLSSGGWSGDSSAKWRYQRRGGYSILDDPGLMLRLTQPHILESLSQIPFCDLPISDKLTILSCLLNQILTFSVVRDAIDERMDKIRQGRVDLRSNNANDRRREQEAIQKFRDGEWTAEQLEKERELLHRRKQDQARRVKELNEENQSNQILPLGLDRAYRRYWMFTSIPGLFVENDERHAGTCLPRGTPALDLRLIKGEDPEIYMKRLFEQGSNKENLATPSKTSATPTKSPSKASLKSPTKGASTPNKKAPVDEKLLRRPLTCWADPVNCPVHSGNSQRVCWAFFKEEADVDNLIANLNKRGVREQALQATLEDDREKIVQSISRCPVSRLNPTLCPVDETRKSLRNNPKYDNANLNFPPGTPSEEILESVLRDLILETEEKINNGCLGSLKVQDRKAWRDALESNTYDQQCEKLTWGNSGRINGESQSNNQSDDEGQSRPSSPSSEASFRDLQLDSNIEQRNKIRELACAILQLEQSIDPKYLKRPLGLDKKENNKNGSKAAQIARERWEASLMTSTSLSQLFLHISTLDTSITWARSILKASCVLCRRRGDPEKMLLCDGCNKGHHMYCLKPKLNNVPKGDWYCAKCKPREKLTPVKNNRRIFCEESEEEEEEDEENESTEKTLPLGFCKTCRTKGQVISCESCNSSYHFDCVVPVLRKIPAGNWYCQKCRRGSTTSNKKEEISPSSDGERSSRRRSSKAATAKISQFAKQLRTNAWNGESDSTPEGSRRRSRRSLETELTVNTNSAAKDLPLDNATLQELLDQLMHHTDAWPFLKPVTRADVEDYHKIIKHPMDFGTIKHKLNMLEYRDNSEVIADAVLVFENCYAYNKEDTEIYQCGVRLHELLEKLCLERGLKLDIDYEKAPASKKARNAL